MKLVKRLIIVFLLIICLVLTCESYQSYLSTCTNYLHYVSFYCPDNVTISVMLSELSEAAKRNNIMLLKIEKTIKSRFSSNIDIYADESAYMYLEKNFYIFQGKYRSLFSGETSVSFKPFENIPDDLVMQRNNPIFRLIGDEKNMREFKSELVNKYAGCFPRQDEMDKRKEIAFFIISVWTTAIILVCFFTLYDSSMQKKENYIRITIGENTFFIWTKYVLSDLIFIIISFVVCSFLVYYFYRIKFMSKITLIMFAIMVLMNAVISVNLLFYDKTKALSNIYISTKLLVVNKSVKCVSVVLSAASISILLVTLYECGKYYIQKPFYERFSDYCMIDNLVQKSNIKHPFELESEFYNLYANKLNIFYLCGRAELSSGNTAVMANSNTKEYLLENIPELKKCFFDKDVYIIYNEETHFTENDLKLLNPHIECTLQEFTYNNNVEIIMTRYNSGNEVTFWVKNPVIVFFNTDQSELYDSLAFEVPITLCYIREDVIINEYMEKNNLNFSTTNFMEIFENRWLMLSQIAYLSVVLVILILILQVTVIISIIKFEYTVNAIELSIKKILGYTMMERFWKYYLSSFFLYLISLFIAIVISSKLNFEKKEFIIWGVAFAYVTETILFTAFAKKYDKGSVQKILKGGFF